MFDAAKDLGGQLVAAYHKSPARVYAAGAAVALALSDQFTNGSLTVSGVVVLVTGELIRRKVWSPNSVDQLLDESNEALDDWTEVFEGETARLKADLAAVKEKLYEATGAVKPTVTTNSVVVFDSWGVEAPGTTGPSVFDQDTPADPETPA